MAEKIVSPGVFTQEKDLSFLAEGISAIGATVIGPTEKGPAFLPVVVTSQNEFSTKFGSGTYYTPYTVQDYLKSAGIVTIVRVLGTSSWGRRLYPLTISGSTWDGTVLAVIGATGSDSNITTLAVSSGSTLSDFVIDIDGIGYSASFDSRKASYITNVLTGEVPAEVAINFPTFQSMSVAQASSQSVTAFSTSFTGVETSSFGPYTEAVTPWIVSQNMSNQYSSLFKVHTLGDGIAANTDLKVGVFDVQQADEVTNSDYGKFSLVIRRFSDTDARPETLETFNNATLDPDSVNYLPRLVGDRWGEYKTIGGESKLVYSGDWPNKSSYIRIEMTEVAFPKGAVPMGFNGLTCPYNDVNLPSASFVTTQTINGETNTRAFRGLNFSDGDTKAYFADSPTSDGFGTVTTGSNKAFHLDDYIDFTSSIATRDAVATRKFMLAPLGGGDGLDSRIAVAKGGSIKADNTQRFDCTDASSNGSVAYKKAIDAIANPDEVDINMIIVPGILYKYHSYVANQVINVCEVRGDCFYIMDTVGLDDSITEQNSNVATIDTNYAATYYPWVKIVDPNTNKPEWAPPSVVMAGVYAFNDKVAEEWFAPAGLNRGGITSAVEAYTRLTHTERDTLYNARSNPIAQFPGQGVVAWGQKTLQSKASALDRVNVRRLLIALKKFIASSSRYLVFEQNVTATRNRFLNIANPYLESVQNRAGLYAFKVVMDETNNTADVIDRNELYGQIYLQPTKTAEFIILDFNILPTGATFPE
jgi:hypothetical protein